MLEIPFFKMNKLPLLSLFFATSSNLLAGPQIAPSNTQASRRSLAVIFAADNSPNQASINFYRSVYQTYSQNSSWDLLSFATMRAAMSRQENTRTLGGLPTIDRESFRKKLPRKSSRKPQGKIIPGSPVPELQRLLDNLRSPAAIVIDCAKKSPVVLRGCALYFYDRVSSRVTASVVKTFVSGATDATAWAGPMVKTLEEGIAASEREKDLAIIEELVARQEDDEDKSIYGVIGVFGKGDRTQLSNNWHQTISGAGLQLGMLSENVGATLEYGYLNWKGSGDLTTAERINYGINMMFRAHALDSLLWFFEIGGGKESNRFVGTTSEDMVDSFGVYVHVTPGVGVELSESISLNLGVGWRWYFESTTSSTGLLTGIEMEDSRIPSLSLRATILL